MVIGYVVVVAEAEFDGEAALLEGVLMRDEADDIEDTLTREGTDLVEGVEGESSGDSLAFLTMADTLERILIGCRPVSAWFSDDDDDGIPSSDWARREP